MKLKILNALVNAIFDYRMVKRVASYKEELYNYMVAELKNVDIPLHFFVWIVEGRKQHLPYHCYSNGDCFVLTNGGCVDKERILSFYSLIVEDGRYSHVLKDNVLKRFISFSDYCSLHSVSKDSIRSEIVHSNIEDVIKMARYTDVSRDVIEILERKLNKKFTNNVEPEVKESKVYTSKKHYGEINYRQHSARVSRKSRGCASIRAMKRFNLVESDDDKSY